MVAMGGVSLPMSRWDTTSLRERTRVSFHYRCRCGQEVVLRPREGMYLAIGALVGISLLNTILLFVLWGKVGEPAPLEPAAPTLENSGSGNEGEGSGTGSETARADSAHPEGTRGGAPASSPFPDDPFLDDPEAGAQDGDLPTRANPPGDSVSTDRSSIEAPPPVPELLELRLAKPSGLDLQLLAALLEEYPVGTLDRTLVLLAVCRWGEDLSIRGSNLLRAEAPPLFEALSPGDGSDSTLLLRRVIDVRDPRDRAVRGELAALDQVWEARWRTILDKARSDPDHAWRTALSAAGGEGARRFSAPDRPLGKHGRRDFRGAWGLSSDDSRAAPRAPRSSSRLGRVSR